MFKKVFQKGISKNYYWAFLGNLASAASQWVVLMLISKLYGTAQMGSYSLALAWILPLYAFFSLQIRNIHVADQANSYGFNLFFQLRLLGAVLFFITVCLIGALFYKHVLLIFVFGGLFKVFEMISDMIHAEFHKRSKNEVYGKLLLLRAILAITLNLLLFNALPSFQIGLVSLPLAYVITLLIDFRLLGNLGINISFDINKPMLKKVAGTGILTGLSLLLLYLLPNIPRFILEKFRNSFELGLYSGYSALVIFSRIFVQSVVQNSLPRLARYYDEDNLSGFLSILKKEGLMVLALGLLQFLLLPIANWLFPILFNRDFIGNTMLLSLIFCGSIFSFIAFVLNNGINAMKMFSIQLPVYTVLTILSLVLGWLIIPYYGINGAGMVYLLVNILLCIMLISTMLFRLKSRQKAIHNQLTTRLEVC